MNSPGDGLALLELARDVVRRPESWPDAVLRVRNPQESRLFTSSEQLGRILILVRARQFLTPEPVGCVAAALAFEVVQGLKNAQPAIIRDVGHWAAAHTIDTPC